MEKSDCDKSSASCEDPNLNRSRSFKSKQLVRSQAIRESQSPPRTVSPAVTNLTQNNGDVITDSVTTNSAIADSVINNDVIADSVINNDVITDNEANSTRTLETSSHNSDDNSNVISVSDINVSDNCNGDFKKLPVEIQITAGAWEAEPPSEQRQRASRWLRDGNRNYSDSSRDLLSNNPRVACVCGYCGACPHCRGRRRRLCATKQDSGVVCSDECADCCDNTTTGGANNEDTRKSSSLDVEDQTFYCRCPERKDKPKNISLSKSESVFFADGTFEPTGVDVVRFLKETLNKNSKDRFILLRIEKELHSLVNDTGRCIVRFPVMSSYHRLLVHRCAALFQLSHHLDHSNKTCVLVSKSGTSGGRIPCTSFKEWCTINFPPSPQRLKPDATNAKSILKRATHSLEEGGAGALSACRSKSLEQRERDYERVRRRIFSTDNCTQDESQWPWLTSGPVKVLAPEGGRNKLLKVQSLEGSGGRSRGAVSKSHSFGGYSADPHPPPHPHAHPPRLLSRQGDLASSSWRLSPSSSGYKTLSLRSTDSVTPSPTGGASPEPGAGVGVGVGAGPGVGVGLGLEGAGVVWAVTDMAAVPPGALVIHPQTGRPLTNADGSVYHFDPSNPPILYDSNAYIQNEQKAEQSCDQKRRGRLEKQHSFIDNECECPPQEECRSKCCCEYRRHDAGVVDKETKKTPSPQTYEQTHSQEAANHRPYEATNQGAEVNAYDSQVRRYEQNSQLNEALKVNHDAHEYPQFVQGITEEQVQPPRLAATATQVAPHIAHAYDITQNMQDTHLRPVSLTNMMYPTQLPQYPYINQCRMDGPLQQVYQPVIPQPTEEQKPLQPSPHTNDSTFRIDPSYPYAACGACVDTTLQHTHRSYNVPFTGPTPMQVEPGASASAAAGVPATVLPSYPVGNLIMPQMHPYQEQVQWANMQPQVGMGVGVGVTPPKLYIPELYPIVQYPHPHQQIQPYHQYNVLYPQVIPQHFVNPICQPMYPVIEKPDIRRNSIALNRQSKRNSAANSARNTPDTHEKIYDGAKERPNEIALKIQQIKDQMAQMNVGERDRYRRTDDLRRRNSGNGILGSYPVNNFNGRVAGGVTNNDHQLTSAARAIVNSIRNMQAKNTYHQDTRRSFDTSQRVEYHRQDRPDRHRHRQDERDVTHAHAHAHTHAHAHAHDDRDRRLNVPLQYRPPYLLRQMSPGTWCRRSPGPVHPVMNQPRRSYPDTRNGRR